MSKADKRLAKRIKRVEKDIYKLRERANEFAGPVVAEYELRGELDIIRASVAGLLDKPRSAEEKVRDKLARSLSGEDVSKRQWRYLTRETAPVAEEFVANAYKRADAVLADKTAEETSK